MAELGLLAALGGCAPTAALAPAEPQAVAPPERPRAAYVNASLSDIARRVASSESPELLSRLRRDPLSFFRYANGPFTAAICAAVAPASAHLPEVNLHGDAHIEQYAVAADGRGLADFDAATSGPFVVDLVRFATSLRLAVEQRHLGDGAADAAITALLGGYRAALVDPAAAGPEPAVVARIRERFAPTPGAWLDRVDGFMAPLEEAKRLEVARAGESFITQMLRQNPDLSRNFFALREIGVLKMGVGSAHERKFLARVAGPTDEPDDDVIFEVKEVTRIEPGTCVVGDPERDPRRVIRGQALLSGVHQPFLGFVNMEGRSFYVHAWRVNYTELDLADLQRAEDLVDVSFDVGLQLGRGHPRQRWNPPGHSLAGEILRRLDEVEPEIRETSRRLATETVAAWGELCELGGSPAPSGR